MANLSENQYKATFGSSMRQLPPDAEPPFDFGSYFDSIPGVDFAGYECRGGVTYVWEDSTCRFQHVLFNSQDKNVFMVVVLDLVGLKVVGHRLLNLNQLYGLSEA
jgi:hypothetical protein